MNITRLQRRQAIDKASVALIQLLKAVHGFQKEHVIEERRREFADSFEELMEMVRPAEDAAR